ncbi:hypothetical protein D3C77_248980 [compost metagenome]
MRGEDQIGEQHTQRENEQCRIAGQLLLVGKVSPFETHAFRQHLPGQTLHDRNRLPRTDARHRPAGDIGRWIAVVADHPVRPGTRRNGDKRGQRQHRPGLIAYLQPADGFGLHAMIGIGLSRHLVGAAEAVEVVDVEGAQINLQRFEDIRQLNPLAFGLGTINDHIELRCIDVETGHKPGDLP